MEFFECLHDLDKSKENIIITILTGKNICDKIILSNKDIVYKSNDTLDWKKIISYWYLQAAAFIQNQRELRKIPLESNVRK